MKTSIGMATSVVLAVVAVGMAPMFTGCQSLGAKSGAVSSDVCPLCGGKTTTVGLADMKCTKHVCPACKNVSTIDPSAPASFQDYIDPLERTVHACENCGAMVCVCATCRGE